MRFEEFLGKVQERAALDSTDSAMRATRATLNTLAERLYGNEPTDLASQLPGEIGIHLNAESAGSGERFDTREFVRRVSQRARVDERDAAVQARAVLQVLSLSVSAGEMRDVKQQLPESFMHFFQ
jgi:uncharacterized protein (DUF2267 family)